MAPQGMRKTMDTWREVLATGSGWSTLGRWFRRLPKPVPPGTATEVGVYQGWENAGGARFTGVEDQGCPVCKGYGVIDNANHRCSWCDGFGEVPMKGGDK